MKKVKDPKDMTLTELRKALPEERKRAAKLRKVATESPDLGVGWCIAATSAEKDAAEMERLIGEKSKKKA